MPNQKNHKEQFWGELRKNLTWDETANDWS